MHKFVPHKCELYGRGGAEEIRKYDSRVSAPSILQVREEILFTSFIIEFQPDFPIFAHDL